MSNVSFSSLLCEKAEQYFQAARPYFGGREQEILENLNQCNDNHSLRYR